MTTCELQTGVYRITCLVNGKLYIGSTGDSFKNRWASHVNSLNRGGHHSTHLQRSWNKHGRDKFEFAVIERCEKKNCLDAEQVYIDLFNSANAACGFNASKFAVLPAGCVCRVRDWRELSSTKRKASRFSLVASSVAKVATHSDYRGHGLIALADVGLLFTNPVSTWSIRKWQRLGVICRWTGQRVKLAEKWLYETHIPLSLIINFADTMNGDMPEMLTVEGWLVSPTFSPPDGTYYSRGRCFRSPM